MLGSSTSKIGACLYLNAKPHTPESAAIPVIIVKNPDQELSTFDNRVPLLFPVILNTVLFAMIVGALTACHKQYT